MGIVLNKILESSGNVFIRSGDEQVTYDTVAEEVQIWLGRLEKMNILPGQVVSLVGRFSADATILLLALLENRNIVVPLDDGSQENIAERNVVSRVSHCIRRTDKNEFSHDHVESYESHPLIDHLSNREEAGIILFTSGSTGKSKAAVHSLSRMLSKYSDAYAKKAFNILVFLKFDHIGGFNTMLSVLMHGGCMTEVLDRRPHSVCQLIEKEKVEILPTTPSFLTMLIMSRAWEQYKLSSLKMITYGTEPMPEPTLKRLFEVFPHIKFKQTYGLTELGIFPTRSRSDQSSYIEIQKNGVKTKVVDNILFVKCDMMMLGYLNAPSPFDDEGWYNTGDRVLIDGTFIKILGRESEVINVAGEKVFPIETESVLLGMSNVKDVSVEGKANPLVGQIVAAVFQLHEEESVSGLQNRVIDHCRGKLENYKVPRHIVITDKSLTLSGLKKSRRNISQTRY